LKELFHASAAKFVKKEFSASRVFLEAGATLFQCSGIVLHNVMSTEKNLEKILELMRRDDSVDAPADSLQWAGNIFRTRAAEPKPSLIKKLVAVLQMELDQNTPAFGERSATTSSVRQILYRADENAVDLRIEKLKKGFTIRGQVLGDGFAAAKATLSDDVRTFEATANESSEFRFDNIPAGSYQLTVRGSRIEMELKGVNII
jgi:hypothetical protein